jgi:hypothetical protein
LYRIRGVIVERGNRAEQVAVATSTIKTIFSSANVLELAVMLLRHFLILRPCDFEAWEEDPEEWELEVTGDVVSAESGFRVIFFHLTFSNFYSNRSDRGRSIVCGTSL